MYYPNNNWQTIIHEKAGIFTSALNNLLNRIDNEHINLHGLVLLYDGYIAYEKYWDSSYKEKAEYVFPITKSVVSLLVGIAISEKLINVEDMVISCFPELSTKIVDDNMRLLKVKNLLTMSSGQENDSDWDNLNSVERFITSPLIFKPGCRFSYLNGCATMLSAIIQKVTGKNTADYAYEKLFSRIGIKRPQWDVNPDGICYGGSGIWLKTRDIARLGLLLINRGKWENIQVIPEDYIIEATDCSWPSVSEGDPYKTSGYGYLFWKNAPAMGGYRGTGWKGHHCIVIPEHSIVCATTADGDMYAFLHAFEEEIISDLLLSRT